MCKIQWVSRKNIFPTLLCRSHLCHVMWYHNRNILSLVLNPILWIDDIYITGMLAPKVMDIEYVDLLRNFTVKANLAYVQYTTDRRPVSYLLVHVTNDSHLYGMWNATLNWLTRGELNTLGEEVFSYYPYLQNKVGKVMELPVGNLKNSRTCPFSTVPAQFWQY